jgi:hypothetical protein
MTPSTKRFVLLRGPGGWLTCLPVGHHWRETRYGAWDEIARVNAPLDDITATAAKLWALCLRRTDHA